ncbi:unnamed protein product [Cladocopium goreaui]|uniref:RING-type domain-containing protein n=1 Tax=Cladocopium goreaui TaxID=2562237 RepID=A0A9P1CL18_9DINO|nr:unnamed protein product [Cladocopium goreaui]
MDTLDEPYEPCKKFVNVNRRGGFGLRGLLCAARVENDAMDKKQVARAQKVLDSDSGGKGRKASLIYDVYKKDSSGKRPPRSSADKKVSLREPDPELDTLWAPERCVCRCGCRAELGNGEGSRCKDCRQKGPRPADRSAKGEGRVPDGASVLMVYECL